MNNQKPYRNLPVAYHPDFGKVPPQAIDIEEMVIGTCLIYPDVIYETKLKPEMFYKDANQKIFATILELATKSKVDLITVTNRLKEKSELESVGGPIYITKLTGNIYSDQMIGVHSLIVKEKYLRREYIRISTEIQNRCFDESFDFTELIEYSENSLFEISDFTQAREPEKLERCIDELLIDIEKIYKKEKSLVGVPSGFTVIDRITGGWQPGNLIIIAGRPSMGKTALALTLASNPAKLKYPVCLFSLEMSRGEITTRFLSSVTGYTNVEIRNADIDFDKVVTKSNDIAGLPIIIDDTASLGLFELRSKVKKMIIKSGVKLVIVDYLQLMSAEAGNREQEISKISRGLKAISKEFNIPVIALSQLNRGVEERADKRPRLSDLRESGAIEQDADIVCFVYRPAYYGISTIKVDKDDVSTEGLMLIDCAKDRSGSLFTKPLYHNVSLTTIQDHKIETPNNLPY